MKLQATEKLGRAATSCAAVLPACVTVALILKYGVDVPYWDQWDHVPLFEHMARGSLTLAHLFEPQNEYRQFFPNLIFVTLGWVTRWDVRYEMLLSFLLACLVSLNIYRLSVRTIADPFWRGPLFLLANLCIFSPMQYENWLFGIQIVYFMPIACITTGVLVAYSDKLRAESKFLICAALSLVSTFSSANGFLCWLVLPPVLALARPRSGLLERKWWLLAWALCFAVCAALYAYDLKGQAPPSDLSPLLSRPADALIYFLSFLGGPFALGRRPLAQAVVVGALLAAAFACASFFLWKRRAEGEIIRRQIGWVMIGAYSICTAALVTFGRLGFGVEQSLSTRYTTFSLYLPVSLIYLLPALFEAAKLGGLSAKGATRLRRLGLAASAGLLLIYALSLFLVIRNSASSMNRELLRAKACLLFINVAPQESCLATLHPKTPLLQEWAKTLDRMGFLRPALIHSDKISELAADSACSEERGTFDLSSSDDDSYVARGWARLPPGGRPADAVVLAHGPGHDDQAVFALAEMGGAGDAGWRKSFPASGFASAPPGEFTAWAFDADTGKAYKLCGARPPGLLSQ